MRESQKKSMFEKCNQQRGKFLFRLWWHPFQLSRVRNTAVAFYLLKSVPSSKIPQVKKIGWFIFIPKARNCPYRSCDRRKLIRAADSRLGLHRLQSCPRLSVKAPISSRVSESLQKVHSYMKRLHMYYTDIFVWDGSISSNFNSSFTLVVEMTYHLKMGQKRLVYNFAGLH